MFPGNPHIARSIAEKLGSEVDADCTVVFYTEEISVRAEDGGDGEDGADATEGEDGGRRTRRRLQGMERTIGDPLPGHQFVLRCMSERFRAKIDRWDGAGPKGAGPAAPSAPGRLELRVSLNSEEEEPSARAAIGVGYTGRVQAGSMREALQVRRQGGYLRIEGCAAACDKFIADRLQQPDNSSSGAASASDQGGSSQQPPVLELFSCSDLFPDPTEDASFAAVLAPTRQALVLHLGSTLAVLNTPLLTQQMLALPAVAVEALLGSDGFATDSESSVLLLLATWMKANFGKTDAATRKRLCRLVRLVQLGRLFVTSILPALAADFEARGASDSPGAWFPIRCMEAAFVAGLALASSEQQQQQQLREAGGLKYDLSAPWYDSTARPQGVLSAYGLVYSWHVSAQHLQQALQQLQSSPGEGRFVQGAFCKDELPYVAVDGLVWQVSIKVQQGEGGRAAAGVWLGCQLPDAYLVAGSRIGSEATGATTLSANLVLQKVGTWRTTEVKLPNYFLMGCPAECPSALSLRQPPAEGGEIGAWVDYLHSTANGGRIVGRLTL